MSLFWGLVAGLLRPRPSLKQVEQSSKQRKVLWAQQLHSTELRYTLLTFAASFFELRCTLWAALQPPSYTALHSYTAALYFNELYYTLLSCTAPCWAATATLLRIPPTPCTLLSYAAPFWILLHLLSNAAPTWALRHGTPYWATLHPPMGLLNLTELRCTLLSYAVPY